MARFSAMSGLGACCAHRGAEDPEVKAPARPGGARGSHPGRHFRRPPLRTGSNRARSAPEIITMLRKVLATTVGRPGFLFRGRCIMLPKVSTSARTQLRDVSEFLSILTKGPTMALSLVQVSVLGVGAVVLLTT